MLQVSKPNNIEVIKGNGLAVFIDANTNKITFKDSNGVIEKFTSITGNVDGNGTPTYLPKWEDANTLNDSVINQDSNSNVFSRTGLVYDARMTEHRCTWDDGYPEEPSRLTQSYDRCVQYGLVERCVHIEV